MVQMDLFPSWNRNADIESRTVDTGGQGKRGTN